METPATKYFAKAITDQKGLDFLKLLFQYYVILDIRTTKVYNVEEIVELGLVITKTDYLGAMYSYNTFVKPTILKRVSTQSQVEHGLIVISDKCIMERHFPSQCEISQRLNQNNWPSAKAMQPFQQWCCLRDMYGIVRDIAIDTQGYSVASFNTEYYKTYSGLIKTYPRCVDRANALIPLLKMYSLILQRDLFPTTMVSIPLILGNPMYAYPPTYFSFNKMYAPKSIDSIEYQSGRYAGKFDKDGIYIGSDEEEEFEATAALFPHTASKTCDTDTDEEEEFEATAVVDPKPCELQDSNCS